jgi:hypothetical protein
MMHSTISFLASIISITENLTIAYFNKFLQRITRPFYFKVEKDANANVNCVLKMLKA